MNKLTYVELIQNNTVLVRDLNKKRMNNRLKNLGLSAVTNGKNLIFQEVITNINKRCGSIFEGTL